MGRIRAPWGLYKRKYPDGRFVWWYYIYDKEGVRHRVTTGQTVKSRAMGEVTRRLVEGTAFPSPPPGKGDTVCEWGARIWTWNGEYIKGRLKRGQLTEKYVRGMLARFKKHVDPELGDIKIQDVTVRQLDSLLLALSDRVSSATVNLVYIAMKTVWDEAYRVGDLNEEVFKRLRPMTIVTQKRNILSVEEALSFLSREWWESDMAWAHNLVAATTGARKSELCALRVGDVQKDRIHIQATVRALEGVVDDTKTGAKGKRYAAIPPAAYEAVKPFLTRPADAFLFETTPGEPTSTHFSMRVLEDARDLYNGTHEAKLPAIVFHSWRHFVVSALSSRCRPDSVSLHVGHSIPGVKGTYVHQTEDHIQECLGALAEVFAPLHRPNTAT